MQNKNLLIIYKDSKIPNLNKLKPLFEMIVIPKMDKRINFDTYKKEGNVLATRYNDIIFSTDAENIFFICASEFKKIIDKIIDFDINGDFSYFIDKKTGNLLEFLSGFAVKREILIKIGGFDKYIFHNLFLNFLINYSRFFPEKNFTFPRIKLNIKDYTKVLFWDHFENCLYIHGPLQKQHYIYLTKIFFKRKPNRIINYIVLRVTNFFCSDIDKFILDNTYMEYW